MTRSLFGGVAVAALLAAGCGPGGPDRGTARGRITVGGKSVSNAIVAFHDPATGEGGSAELDEDGRYEVTGYQAVGLPVGTYRVSVTPGRFMQPGEERPLAGKAPPPPKRSAAGPVPVRYHLPDTSKLTAEVKKGDNPPFDFDLDPKP